MVYYITRIDVLDLCTFVFYITEKEDNCDSSVSPISGLTTTNGDIDLNRANSKWQHCKTLYDLNFLSHMNMIVTIILIS